MKDDTSTRLWVIVEHASQFSTRQSWAAEPVAVSYVAAFSTHVKQCLLDKLQLLKMLQCSINAHWFHCGIQCLTCLELRDVRDENSDLRTRETDQEGRKGSLLRQLDITAVCLLQFHFFAGLSFYTTDRSLLEAFSQFGTLLDGVGLSHPFTSTNFFFLTLNSNIHEPTSLSLSLTSFILWNSQDNNG